MTRPCPTTLFGFNKVSLLLFQVNYFHLVLHGVLRFYRTGLEKMKYKNITVPWLSSRTLFLVINFLVILKGTISIHFYFHIVYYKQVRSNQVTSNSRALSIKVKDLELV